MPRRLATTFALASIFGATPSWAQDDRPAKPDGSMAALFRYEPTGLSILSPHQPGKIPVVFIHGLWLSPSSWHAMISGFEADPALRDRYQFWTFGYSTGDPIPYSAHLLRRDLDAIRKRLDPDGSDRAFDRMVLVGHSMGGLVSRMMVAEAGDAFWRVVSDRPFADLKGDRVDLELFREGLLFAPRREVRRVVYIATPHRGSDVDRGGLQKLGTRLVRISDPLRASHERLISGNPPDFFLPRFRRSIPSSIEGLQVGSPILTALSGLPTAPAVTAHSIIAVRPDSPPAARTDGLVAYASAHRDDVASEKVVDAGHLCQDDPGSSPRSAAS